MKRFSRIATFILLTVSVFHLTAGAQTLVPPFPGRPASGAWDVRPCIPLPSERYQVSEPNRSPLFEATGNPDRDFASMMSAHHQEGVDIARLELQNGRSSKLKAIARRIIKDQQQEIFELDKWSERHNVRLSKEEGPTQRP